MKWFNKKIVNKSISLPWIETRPEKNLNLVDAESGLEESIHRYTQPNSDMKASIDETLSMYNHEIGFSDSFHGLKTQSPELNQFSANLVVDNEIYHPIQENINNKSIQKISQIQFNETRPDIFNPLKKDARTYPVSGEPGQNFLERGYLENHVASGSSTPVQKFPFQPEKYLLNPVSADKLPDNDTENPPLLNSTITPESLLSQPMEDPVGNSPDAKNNYIENLHSNALHSEIEKAENAAITFKEHAEKENKHKHVFRCSITPEVKTNDHFRIPYNVLHTGSDAMDYTDPVEVQSVIEKLESTLDQFGIEARVIGMQKGPIITRYELRIPPGIKVNRILGLTEELAMALEALRVRIEAPIPGRSTVGIEIPNKKRSTVLLGDILNHPEYNGHSARLPLPLGKDIAGNLLIEDLARMPHILIAGTTGSGKSVAINSFITSMIISKSPAEVRMLMVDPKLVELSQYNDIPHLLHPVIADPQKAILALNWAVEEMERRYEDMAEMRARDIVSYNGKVEEQNKESRSSGEIIPKMPYIVVLIDELGDLMMVAGKEVESSIIRLSQKARAIGIHLILATQRPSVDVITALIKANCPARIALQVAQKTDSRTILDSNGGEQLLGQGDMLFKHPSKAQLIRAQAPYVSDSEVENIVHLVKKLGKPSYITLEDPKSKAGEMDIEDESLFDEAWQIISESKKASASYLQRRLRIGYNKAARLIEAFEARGYIGPQIGSKPRDILLHN
ncbi:MAG: DNA translocase FtsK [Spirochaetia bacterium]|nr:DNA translocase FtsK [Spirochaetia bacterium]